MLKSISTNFNKKIYQLIRRKSTNNNMVVTVSFLI